MLEEDFKVVFSKFFPFPGLASSISSGSSLYAHYVFSCVDVNGMGIVNFEVVFEFIDKKIPERSNSFFKGILLYFGTFKTRDTARENRMDLSSL